MIPAARAIAGGIWAGNRGRGRCRAARRCVRRGGSKRERGQDHEGGHLDQAGGDAGARADLLEPEQPGPDRQEIAAEGSEGEAGSRRGRQPAGDSAASRRGMASTASPRPKAAITCSRNSHPIVGIVRYPVRYRSRWIAAVAISRPEPTTRRMTAGQPGAGRSASSRAARPAPLIVPILVMLCRSVICQSSA